MEINSLVYVQSEIEAVICERRLVFGVHVMDSMVSVTALANEIFIIIVPWHRMGFPIVYIYSV